MSEDRNDAGQFTAAEPLTGRAGLEADAGFEPVPVVEAEAESTFDNPREAAKALAGDRFLRAESTDEINERPIIEYATGDKLEEKYTFTLEQAADSFAAVRSLEHDGSALSISKDFAAAIDQMRADAIKADPKMAEKLEIEPPVEAAAEPAKGEFTVTELAE